MKKEIFFVFCILLMSFFFSLGAVHAENISKARDLYSAKCAKCHKFYDPAGYDDAGWCRWMEKMRKKAHLDSEEYSLIVRYCNSLRKVKN